MKNKKGFTLIELLAVIVILGLLMAIAIPSVTKYITESRKKTVVSTIGNYITAMVNEVNDLTYTFTEENTIYAVPVECIALERGGTNPFGAWHQANDAYWAYVLVQYDDETSSYRYGYTFKDSAGYGLYPTTQAKLNEGGKQIQTGLKLNRPSNGKITNIASVDNWRGFDVDSTTNLVVLKSEVEGNVGDGKTTCTLHQKGDNYDSVINEKDEEVSINDPLYFEEKYSLNADGVVLSIMFFENGSVGLYENCQYVNTMPEGSVDFVDNKVILGGELIISISADKKRLTVEDGGDVFTLDTSNECIPAYTLYELIMNNNPVITTQPTLNKSSCATGEKGFYSSTDTNSGRPTYYFRGNVENNYVDFAGHLWRIIRINEYGSIRLILNDVIDDNLYKFNSVGNSSSYMYYSNSDVVKPTLQKWYDTNIVDKGYGQYVVSDDFCEQAKVMGDDEDSTGNATMKLYSSYTPTFKCSKDGNGKGPVSTKVALISYDEVVFAGGYYGSSCAHYLGYQNTTWTMTPSGNYRGFVKAWYIGSTGTLLPLYVYQTLELKPVINIYSDYITTGSGTKTDPYKFEN